MTTRAVHQLLHTLSYGDAISGEALALQRCLRSLGFTSDIFAINVHPVYKKEAETLGVKDYRSFPQDVEAEVILHYSLGSPLNDLYRSLSRAQRTLIYHNLTPARWFRGVNPRIVRDIEQGMRELPGLCSISHRLIADSAFNAGELAALGFQDAQVLNLPIDPHRWDVPRNEGIFSLVSSQPGINVVHIGRLAPNKCIEDIIKAFYFLNRFIDKHSRLWLAGIDIDTEIYSFSLKRLVHALGLEEHVIFAGCMADSELRALYEGGSVYCCMSEHEGFCLPVVEAMHFGMPVVAFASSALPDTIGSGGIVVQEKRHAEIAELLAEVARNQELRSSLITAGKARVASLSYDLFAERVKEIFEPPGQTVA
ncbi:MAG: glycosyltransferase, partial [Proteobacteria bacterium]|nr:glycosyltransferase [Pseudomonadota bacterium]